MAYISYKDVPLYFGTDVNSNTLPQEADANNKGIICQQLQLNYTPNIAPVRILGKDPTRDNFNLAGPPNASLSFSAYVETGEFNITGFTGDVGNVGSTFRIGDAVNGISGSGAFLTSYSFTLAAYQPVLVQADFVIYNPLTISVPGGAIADAGSNSVIDDLDFSKYGHGAYSTIQTGNMSSLSTIESVQYQYTANRLPIYNLGSFTPSVVELLTEEQSMQIQGDNIINLVPLTGSNPGPITGSVKDSNNNEIFEIVVNGRVTAENIAVAGGDLARGSLTIAELLK
tara:strand:+ start:1463 stop:2317 length:855 start_codon:yes stop_codon:yes gene_type:complete